MFITAAIPGNALYVNSTCIHAHVRGLVPFLKKVIYQQIQNKTVHRNTTRFLNGIKTCYI